MLLAAGAGAGVGIEAVAGLTAYESGLLCGIVIGDVIAAAGIDWYTIELLGVLTGR